MRVWIEQTGGIAGRLGAEHDVAALTPEQQRALHELLAARHVAHTAHGNAPRYRLHVLHDDGAATAVTVDADAMPDCLLGLALPR